jgi:uncharacterized protein YbcC (UPF0753/DUF2309 family)
MTKTRILSSEDLMAAADGAGRAIPPVWPLASSVAVNPYLGQTGERLATTGARLARVAGVPVTMPRDWYAERIRDGRISEVDLASALEAAPAEGRPLDLAALKQAAESPARTPKALPTVADLAADASRLDWPGLIAERIGGWAGSYFDAGQALWAAPRRRGPWTEWRAVAIAQAMFPLWAYHPAAAGLRVHLSNGLYANAVFDRVLGGWAVRRTN